VLHHHLERRLKEAIAAVLPNLDTNTQVSVRPCSDQKFGDYQTNALMSLAKQRSIPVLRTRLKLDDAAIWTRAQANTSGDPTDTTAGSKPRRCATRCWSSAAA
jgi:hypothetical protein